MQGGFDYSYNLGASTFYVGTWGSNISWLTDSGPYARSSLESDWYGGFRGNFGATDFTCDGGFLYDDDPRKLSDSVGDSIFAVRDGRGTSYVDVSANYPIGETGFRDRPLRQAGLQGHGLTEHRPGIEQQPVQRRRLEAGPEP